jgi:Tol biopolymer transport system component
MEKGNGIINSSFKSFSLWGWLSILAVLATACSPAGLRLPQSPLLRSLERKSGLIVYVGGDGNIYTIDQSGGNQKALTTNAQEASSGEGHLYQFPAWSPDGQKVAFVGYHFSGNSVEEVNLYTASRDGQEVIETFSSDEHYPFYLYWSPDGENVSFLATPASGGAMTLQMVPAGGGETQILGAGAPFYWAWAPDNRAILVHTGGSAASQPDARLAFVNLEGGVREEELSLDPGLFQAPDWSPNGDELLLAGNTGEPGEDGLLLIDRQGQVKQVLTTVEGQVAFGWSRDGERLAYITGEISSAAESARRLVVVDPQKAEESEKTIEDTVVAFFWSPDSRKLAYFVPVLMAPPTEAEGVTASEPVLLMQLYVMDARSGESLQVAAFQPTEDFINLLPYFDQYQHSATIWSPDSRYLVIAALDGEGEPGVYIVESAANLEPRFLTAGNVGFWSWK